MRLPRAYPRPSWSAPASICDWTQKAEKTDWRRLAERLSGAWAERDDLDEEMRGDPQALEPA